MFFSDYFNIKKSTLENYGALNICLDCDLPLFIDPMLIFNNNKPEYKKLHRNIIKYFNFLYNKSLSGLNKKEILTWFNFSEVPNNWLGYSLEGNKGTALGKKYAIFLHENISFVINDNNITKSQHIEKAMLLYDGTGRDKISDLTVNLIKDYLCEFTQTFAQKHLPVEKCEKVYVEKAYFNYKTESFVSKEYYLPIFVNDNGEKEYLLLTPLDILRKEEQSINKKSFISNYEHIRASIDNSELRTYVDNYIGKALREYQENMKRQNRTPNEKTAKKIEKERFCEIAKMKPEIYDYFIKLTEDNPEELFAICCAERNDLNEFISKKEAFVTRFDIKDYSKSIPKTAREEAKMRLSYFKHMIEDCDLYKQLYYHGNPIAKEEDLQRLFKLVWCDTTRKINAEVNNGRGAADFIICNGKRDQNIIEFKLASNSKLDHVFKQVDIYERANETTDSLIAIFCFSEAEINKVIGIIKSRKMEHLINESIYIIDCRNDNKKSASVA